MSDDLKTVRQAIYLLRAGGTYPSLRLVDTLVRIARRGTSLRKQTLGELVRVVLSEIGGVPEAPGVAGNHNRLVGEPTGVDGNLPEPQIENKTIDTEGYETTVLTLPLVATEPTSREKSGKVATAERSTKKAESKPREQWVAKAVPIDLPERLPETIADLQIVTHAFVVEFGNCASAQSQEKHGYEYTNAIALARKGGWSTAQLWQAFCDARVAKHGVPIFGAQAKSALSYLPERSRVLPFERAAPALRYPGFVAISLKDKTYWRHDGPGCPVGWSDTLPLGGTILPKPLAIVDGAAVAR